jgi:ADP-L-glycero-D-manno-heptose 6-epimerase
MNINDQKNIVEDDGLPLGAGGLVTGAAGFISSCMVQYLNEKGYENLIIVDDFGVEEKRSNWEGKKFKAIIERYNLFNWLEQHNPKISFVIHLGARTDTTEFDYAIHQELNVEYSQNVWKYCTDKQIPLIYASSAATYGSGESGYDDTKQIENLHPLNPYGISKNEFDKWALQQKQSPPFWAGLKFFNVYGPNEYHKGRMASVIFQAFNQIKKDGVVKLFKSHKQGFEDGKQLRDFVYVKDVVKVIGWMMEQCKMTNDRSQFAEKNKMTDDSLDLTEENSKELFSNSHSSSVNCQQSSVIPQPSTLNRHPSSANRHVSSGIYNLGTGTARTFEDLVKATFAGLDMQPNIQYINMPQDIRDKYQYFTEARMQKLRDAGYANDFYSLEEGVNDYVRNYLSKEKIY